MDINKKIRLNDKIIWTIGHSTNPFDKFVGILKSYEIEIVADVRSLPGSRKYPQYNKENLEKSLPENGIKYIHIAKLGGRRKVSKNSINTGWRHPAFRGYADYMETDEFNEGINELITIATDCHTVVMCAESLWWRCHRSMIADYLKLDGWKVIHIFAHHRIEIHTYTQPAKIKNGRLNYTSDGFIIK